jgi:hypothetical protein
MRKALAAIGTVAAAIVIGAQAAFAQTDPLDPVAEVTDLATTGLASVAPILLAVAGIVVGLAALRFGISFVLRMVNSGGKKAG